MSTGTIIAISIVVISILLLIIVGIGTRKKLSTTLKNIKDLNEVSLKSLIIIHAKVII